MIARTISAFCAAAFASAMLAAAQPAATPAGPAAKSDNERLICRAMSDGRSRFVTQRVCHTRAEWADLRRQTRDAIDRIQMMSQAASAH